jgi:RHS repeat-associated protein
MTMNGSQTYEWDAEDRLTAINNGSLRSEFSYDGFGRRVKIVEKNNGTVTDTKKFIWDGEQLVQSIEGPDNPVPGNLVKFVSYYDEGCYVDQKIMSSGGFNEVAGTAYYYTRDHLGSIREMLDNNGNVVARYDYDPYGRRTKVSGTMDADFGYAGYYYHAMSGLYLTVYRGYDGDNGTFINRDPMGEAGGLNLYDYVENDPVNAVDPDGHFAFLLPVLVGAVIGLGIIAVSKGVLDYEEGQNQGEHAKKNTDAETDADKFMNGNGTDPADAYQKHCNDSAASVAKNLQASQNIPGISPNIPFNPELSELSSADKESIEKMQKMSEVGKDLIGEGSDSSSSNSSSTPNQIYHGTDGSLYIGPSSGVPPGHGFTRGF